jgi:cysteine desulfurase
MRRIYLDSNATTPVHPEVLAAMMPVLTEDYGNPSSIHWFGQRAKSLMDDARQQVAKLINAEASEIVFVSGGTEADNLAIRGTMEARNFREGEESHRPHIITSSIEHHAVMHTCKDLEKQGCQVTWLKVSPEGLIDPEDVRRAIRPETLLITLMHANNEIGTIQPIEEIGRIAEEADVCFHSDGVQSAGKIPVDVKRLRVDLYSLSGHKIHGPKGVGALFVRKGTILKPAMTGGGHERNRRSGTENVAGIVGFGQAAKRARETLEQEMGQNGRVRALRDRLESGLKARIPMIRINGENAPRLPNTSNIMVDFAEGEGLVISLDLKGVAVSTGSACSSGSLEPSHVLTAIGKTPDEAHGSLRFSMNSMNSEADVDYVLEVLPGIVERLRELSPHYRKVPS